MSLRRFVIGMNFQDSPPIWNFVYNAVFGWRLSVAFFSTPVCSDELDTDCIDRSSPVAFGGFIPIASCSP